jgi:hypothetical protein
MDRRKLNIVILVFGLDGVDTYGHGTATSGTICF